MAKKYGRDRVDEVVELILEVVICPADFKNAGGGIFWRREKNIRRILQVLFKTKQSKRLTTLVSCSKLLSYGVRHL